jgi:TetR/AcrR family fatty acid metabolism transcriptional regulator
LAPRPNVSVQRTQEVLEAATAVFAKLGFHKARMDDIAEEAGVSKGVLYFYFKSKDAIIEALLKHFFSGPLVKTRQILQAEGTVRERLAELTESFGQEIQFMQRFLPIAFEFYSVAGRNKTVNEYLSNYFHEMITCLSDFLTEGINRGELQEGLDTTQAARSIIAIYEGMTLLWILEKGKFDWIANSRLSITQFIRGIEQRPGQT